jgi:hypothetical protein
MGKATGLIYLTFCLAVLKSRKRKKYHNDGSYTSSAEAPDRRESHFFQLFAKC